MENNMLSQLGIYQNSLEGMGHISVLIADSIADALGGTTIV